ncbi:hypothetical protein BDC45DRAFT_505514, partial [Circinella umbellata]
TPSRRLLLLLLSVNICNILITSNKLDSAAMHSMAAVRPMVDSLLMVRFVDNNVLGITNNKLYFIVKLLMQFKTAITFFPY